MHIFQDFRYFILYYRMLHKKRLLPRVSIRHTSVISFSIFSQL